MSSRSDAADLEHSPVGQIPGSSVFPPELPLSLSDGDAIRRNDWQAFSSLARVENHWNLKPWPDAYAAYYWYLTFSDPALESLVKQCQSLLDTTSLDIVPPDGLHLTLLKVGVPGALRPLAIHDIIEAGRHLCQGLSPLTLDVGPLAGSPSAIRFSVSPWDRLYELHALLRDSLVRLLPESAPKATTVFRPHLGIAYENQQRPAAPVINEVATLRDISPVSVSVDTVTLVRVSQAERHYVWDECGVVRLGG